MASQDPIATTWRSYVAELPAWGIVLGALAVSFWTQVDQVHRHGFAFWEALIWGTSTDAGTIACLFLAREGAHRGTPTWGAWLLSLACAVLSVQYNVVAGVEAGDWLAVEAHLWMPALALGVWYWLLHGRHRRWITGTWRSKLVRDPALTLKSQDAELIEPNRPARLPARAEVRRLIQRHGGRVKPEQIARRTGVSINRARRLLREERALRVLDIPEQSIEHVAMEAET